MDVQMRGLVPYDDKRILHADLTDTQPNPDTHAFGHYSLEAVRMLEPEQLPAGEEMVVVVRPCRNERYEAQLARKHAKVVKKARVLRPDNGDDGNSDGELHGNQLLVAKWEAAVPPGNAIRMGDVIEQIIARKHLKRPVSPPAWMPPPPTPKRAGPSELNAHLLPFRRRVNSLDEEEPERPVWPPRRPRLELEEADYEQDENAEPEPPRRQKKARRRVNPVIDAEAGVDGDVSNDEGTDDENDDLDGFIVADDVEF